MKRFIFVQTVLLLTLFAPLVSKAQDPVGVLSIKSADRLLNGVGTVGRWLALNGSAAEQQQSEQIFRSMIEPHLGSFDKNLPAGAVVWLGPNGMPDVLAFLPLDDATLLLQSVSLFVGQPEPVGDALKFALPGMPPIFVQTKGSWTFVAMSQQRLDTVPADPAKLLGPLPRIYDVALKLNVQAVPQELRDQLLEGASQMLPMMLGPNGGATVGPPDGFPGDEDFPEGDDAAPCIEGEAPFAPGQIEGDTGDDVPFPLPGVDPAMQATIDQQVEALRKFMNETDQLVLGILMDDAKQELRVDFIQKAVAGSATANLFNSWKTRRPTRFAGFYRPAAGFHSHVNMKQSAEQVASWTKQLDQVVKMAASAGGDAQAEAINTVVSAVKSFVSHGDMDMVISLAAADGPNLLMAGKISDPASIVKAMGAARDAMAGLPDVTMRKETVSGVPLSIWTIPIPNSPESAPVIQVLGPALELAAGTTNDSAYVALGATGVVRKLEDSLNKSATPIVRSPVPAMMLLDLKKLVGELDLSGIPGVSEWSAQIAQVQAPMQIRWSTIPTKNAGIYRIQVSGGAVFALAPRPGAERDEESPFGDAGAAFE